MATGRDGRRGVSGQQQVPGVPLTLGRPMEDLPAPVLPVVTESIGYVPGTKPEGLTVSAEAAARLAEAGKVIVDREDLRAVLKPFWTTQDVAECQAAYNRLSAAAGDAR